VLFDIFHTGALANEEFVNAVVLRFAATGLWTPQPATISTSLFFADFKRVVNQIVYLLGQDDRM
jgi:hypothetical protein